MKLATIVLGIAAAAVAAPIQSSDSPVINGLDRRTDPVGGAVGGLLGGDIVKELPLASGLLGGGGKARREESPESTDKKQIDRREALPLGGGLISAAVPAAVGLVGGIGGGGAKVRRDESIESTVAADVEPTGEDAANVQKRGLPVQGDVVDGLLKIVSDTGLKRDGNIVSKEDGTI